MMEKRVRIKLVGVYSQPDQKSTANHFVLFEDEVKRRFFIYVGQFEAWSIALGLEGKATERPFTHDAMLLCLSTAGAAVEEVYINDIRDEMFFSIVSLRVGDKVHQVDLRPSDAVALAVRVKCPIFISRNAADAAHRK